MGTLVESTFVTLDGVIVSPEKWGPPYWDDEHAKYAHDLLFAADALLLGRKSYELFAEAWPPPDPVMNSPTGSTACPSTWPRRLCNKSSGTPRSPVPKSRGR